MVLVGRPWISLAGYMWVTRLSLLHPFVVVEIKYHMTSSHDYLLVTAAEECKTFQWGSANSHAGVSSCDSTLFQGAAELSKNLNMVSYGCLPDYCDD